MDDQVEWLDNGRLLYAVQRASSAISDVWVAPVDDSAPAKVFLSEAASPIVVRQRRPSGLPAAVGLNGCATSHVANVLAGLVCLR